MLQLKNIRKEYRTGELLQTALDGISLNLRDNEFVAVLGPSGSGKTTLLNIVGGLDRYDSGELIINGISTQRYRDRDWDSYRNHSVGFVFQNYNLIPHQTILANVELALTISGISHAERKKRAEEALAKVGLGDQVHKRPNQMSGGQMQRVAIARALVNNPDILLADEPTGALDTDTGTQVMELLKEVAKDRLVVMVTHNPGLAEKYATRIVRLKDGRIIDDSNPLEPEDSNPEQVLHKNMGKASMSFKTALSLSFNNLRTKKARTLLTAFAGSIGIIGIALILSLSNGVNSYIEDLQKDTMTSYPISIEAQSMDLSSIIEAGKDSSDNADEDADHKKDAVYSDGSDLEIASEMSASITENNLTEFKKYLDKGDNEITKHVGENGIHYTYDTAFTVYTHDEDGVLITTSQNAGSDESDSSDGDASGSSDMNGMDMMSDMSETSYTDSSIFEELIPDSDGKGVSEAITDNYDLLYGTWPDAYNEVVLVLDQNNEVSATSLYELGILPSSEYEKWLKKVKAGEEVTIDTQKWSYEDICAQELYLLPACDQYTKSGNGTFEQLGKTNAEIEDLLDDAVTLKISGVIRPAGDDEDALINENIGYTGALTEYLTEHANESAIVTAQQSDKNKSVLSGEKISSDEYEDLMTAFGYVNLDTPSGVDIYADSFEDKEAIEDGIKEYNKSVDEKDQITYTDYVGLLMSSVTTIVDVISYVLIAFVAVSLIVSSIMIGIITYISVLERTKEIGILRAIGASKRNISEVFNAETCIVGLCSGLIGIGLTLLLLIPCNGVIHFLTEQADVNAALPIPAALLLIALSILLTFIGGLIPSKKASKKDPVLALRTE